MANDYTSWSFEEIKDEKRFLREAITDTERRACEYIEAGMESMALELDKKVETYEAQLQELFQAQRMKESNETSPGMILEEDTTLDWQVEQDRMEDEIRAKQTKL